MITEKLSVAAQEVSRTRLFKRLVSSVWIILGFYTVFYGAIHAILPLFTVLIGLLVLSPFTLWLDKKSFHTSARLLFVGSCNLYIYASSLGLAHQVASEYYYLPAIMIPLLTFEPSQKRAIAISILSSFTCWILTVSIGFNFVPGSLLATDVPTSALKIVNFIGAFAISLTFLFIFMKTIFQLKDSLVEQIRNEDFRYKSITTTMSEGLVIQDQDGAILSYNPAALEILGLTADQLTGKTSQDFNWCATYEDGTDFPKNEHPAKVALRTNRAVTGTTMGLTLSNGEERWVRINAVPSHTQDGKRVIVTFSDITQQMKANAEINHIFSHSMDLMCIASTDGTFKRVSPSFTKILGFEGHELLSKPFVEFIHPDDLEATGKIVTELSQGVPLVNFENRYRTKSGGYRLISWVCEPDPKTGLLYAIGRDFTSLRATEVRNQEVLSAIDQAALIAFTDTRGLITEVNKNFCEISGYSASELIGKDHRIVNSGEHPKEFFKEMWTDLKAGKRWTGDLTNVTKSGQRYYVRTVIAPLKDPNGQIKQFMAVRFDMTQQKQLEKEREKFIQELENARLQSIKIEKLASLGEMSAGVAHEINNPLAIISGSISLLTKYANDPEKFALKVEVIRKSCDRIARIVSGLKKFSRSGEKTDFRVHSVKELVREALILTESKSKRHSTPVTVDCKTNASILCGEVEIEQVLVNLVNNGIDEVKNLSDKWVRISLYEEGDSVVLRITDSGRGIPEQVRNKLFEPFFTTKKVGEGTGLGLSITKGILDEHKATITVVADSPNTCFEIRFPRAEPFIAAA